MKTQHNDFDQSFSETLENILKKNVGPMKDCYMSMRIYIFFKWNGGFNSWPQRVWQLKERKKERNELCLDLLGMN